MRITSAIVAVDFVVASLAWLHGAENLCPALTAGPRDANKDLTTATIAEVILITNRQRDPNPRNS